MRTTERWIGGLFLAVALLQLVPVWAPRYYPTMDGPAHLYNAWVMREIALGHDNIVTRTYAIDLKPYPNLLDHVILAVLLGALEAPAAEKVFVSAIILLFLGGAWLFAGAADRRASLFAFLALPLSHHLLLQSGFYNFSLSVGIYFIVVAVWWTRRRRPDWQTITIVALLLLLCYFAHPMSTALAIGSIGVLWLTASRDWRHLIAFLPVLPLLAWFVLRERGRGNPSDWTLWHHFTFLAQTQEIATYAIWQLKFGAVLCAVTLLLMAITVAVERRRREADAFLLILAAVIAAFLLGPGATSGGSMVLERLGLFISLLPLPWLSPRLGKAGRGAFAVAMSVVAIAHTVYLTRSDRRIARETTALVCAARAIPKNRTFFPVVADRQPEGTLLALMWHAGEYAAIERCLVDLNNYEPRAGYFPIRYRDAARMFGVESIANDITNFPADRMTPFAQYVFTWHMPDDAPVLLRLDRDYKLLAISKAGRIYRRRDFLSIAEFDGLLLPVAGTTADAGGPAGERWGVEQTVRNRGAKPVEIKLSTCAAAVPCAFILAPGEARQLASDDPWRPYIVAHVARPGLAGVDVTTVVHRVDRDGSVSRLSIPSKPLSGFCGRRIDFDNVLRSGRLSLRLWSLGAGGSIRVDGRSVAADANGFVHVRDLAPRAGRLHVEADDPDARLWGILTASGARDAGTLLLPRCGS
jgi:hypothetical protein